jgi:hypothetical protein
VGECGCEEWFGGSISMDVCVTGGIVRFKKKAWNNPQTCIRVFI